MIRAEKTDTWRDDARAVGFGICVVFPFMVWLLTALGIMDVDHAPQTSQPPEETQYGRLVKKL